MQQSGELTAPCSPPLAALNVYWYNPTGEQQLLALLKKFNGNKCSECLQFGHQRGSGCPFKHPCHRCGKLGHKPSQCTNQPHEPLRLVPLRERMKPSMSQLVAEQKNLEDCSLKPATLAVDMRSERPPQGAEQVQRHSLTNASHAIFIRHVACPLSDMRPLRGHQAPQQLHRAAPRDYRSM